jgi:hypothetical protein
MRDYYFIGQVAETEFGFSIEDLLHYGAQCGIRLYVHVDGPFSIYNRKDGEEIEDHNFFVALSIRQVMEIEKIHARNTAQRATGTPLVTTEKFRLDYGTIDERYSGWIPIGHRFATEDEEVDIRFVNTNLKSAYFEKHEIVCFTVDLKKLKAQYERIAHIAKYGKDALPPATDELPTTERNTLYKMILGMAMQKYGFNPESRRNTATGENHGSICADLEKAGLPVDADTIREHLKAASAATPPQRKKPNSGKS